MQAICIFSGETAMNHPLTKVLQCPSKKCNQLLRQQGASACIRALPLGQAMAEGSNRQPETKETLVPTRQK